MKRIFRLANAEFNKIFYRPSIFILTALLIITLVATNLLYKPVSKTTKLSYDATNVGGIYVLFTGSNKNEITKSSIDEDLENSYQKILQDFNSITKEDKLKTFYDGVLSLNTYLTETVKDELLRISTLSESQFTVTRSKTVEVFNTLKQKCSELLNYMSKIKGETLNFYLTINEFDTVFANIENLLNAFPVNYDEYKKVNFINLGNTLTTNFSLQPSLDIVSVLTKINIDIDTFNEIVNDYYTEAKEKLEQVYFKDITDFDNENFDSKDESDMQQMNELIAKYYSFAHMNKTILENKMLLFRINDKSDTELKDLIGYSQVSKYQLNEQIQIYEYLINNESFDFDYLTSFNFNKSSGASTNAYDYTVYSMQILSLLIIIFTIFYACSSIAGDQSTGTMKMIAIRPYSRNKLFSGKYLSCVMFGIMLLLIATVASFVVGAVSFGVPMSNCLVVFNAQTVISINPILLLLIYFISLIINLLFYISLAMLICLLFKSNTLSVFITAILYATQVVLNGTVSGAWLKYTPFGHFDLFKYFGNSSTGLLSMNILPDADFTISAIIIGFCIVLFNIISHMIFKTRDIT